jgi:hypothetical protein
MARPELGTLKKGDVVIVRDRYRGSGADHTARKFRVVTLGPKWVGLIDAESRWAGTRHERAAIRRFLLRDQREGEPGSRIGYGCYFATPEQHAYDTLLSAAEEYVRDVAGLEVRRGAVPFAGDDGILKLAHLLNLMESSWRPPSGTS